MTENYSNVSVSSSSSLSSSILAEEENLKFDNKLGKRLSHLDSIRHTPRVNGEIPNVNDATLDHERLSERLVTYGLAELQMEGDGNCQFRALADQLFRNPEYHKHVRKAVIKQLKKFRKLYEGYVPMKYKIYLKKMKKSGEWGDHITLQAAADRSHLSETPVISRSFPKKIITTKNFGSAFGVKCIITRYMPAEIFLRELLEESIGFSRGMKHFGRTLSLNLQLLISLMSVHFLDKGCIILRILFFSSERMRGRL